MSQFLRNTFIWLFIAGATFFALQNFNQGPSSENMTYSEFVSLVNKDQIASVSFQGDGYTINGFKDDGTPFTTTRPIYVQDNQLIDFLFVHQVLVFGVDSYSDSF